MAEIKELGPLTLTREGDVWRFSLAAPSGLMPDKPTDYNEMLAEQLASFPATGDVGIYVDLRETPAISSRQLGVLLALRKVLYPRVERLPLVGPSPLVRRLLDVTHTTQFFELRDTPDDPDSTPGNSGS